MSFSLRLLLMAAFVTSAELLASCASSDQQQQGCTRAGCSSYYHLTTSVDQPFEILKGAKYRACRNGRCQTLQLETVAPDSFGPPLEHMRAEAEWQENPKLVSDALVVRIDATTEPEKSELSVAWSFVEPPLADRQSDEYEVTIELDGRDLYTTAESVSEYSIHQPNGPKCRPTCYSASNNN